MSPYLSKVISDRTMCVALCECGTAEQGEHSLAGIPIRLRRRETGSRREVML